MSTGWICPKCGRALAPWVSSCPCYLENLQITCTQTGTASPYAGPQSKYNTTTQKSKYNTTCQAVKNTSTGKCGLICDNKTDLGYCKTTACIRHEFGGDSNYGIGNGV